MLEQLRQLRFGYLPYAPGGNSPGDRRRFLLASKKLQLQTELYQTGRHYDVVYVTSNSDLTAFHRWSEPRPKLVFEMVDSYLAVPEWDIRNVMRGLGKWLKGQHSHLELRYRQTLARICSHAELVICSTPEQQQLMVEFNTNTHAVLDFHEEMGGLATSEPCPGDKIDLFWEGIGLTTAHFKHISPVLKRLAADFPLRLHLVTDLKYRPLNIPGLDFDTRRALHRMLEPMEFYLAEWNTVALRALASQACLGLIPLSLADPLGRSKPENKLLLMWRLGLPVVASATPAYVRTMGHYGGPDWTCQSEEDWERHLRSAFTNPDLRRTAAQKGREYAETKHGAEALTRRWLEALTTLL